MKAIILAGGYGTRLRSVIGDEIPKCMALVNGKPFIRTLIDGLKKQGIKDITLSLHYKAEVVQEYLGKEVKYKIESEPLGTGGAIRNCISGKAPALVMNGDTIAPIDYHDMLTFHKTALTIAVDKHTVSAGTYIVNPCVFKKVPKKAFSFEKDVIPKIAFSFYRIPWFTDIGTPDGYARANA